MGIKDLYMDETYNMLDGYFVAYLSAALELLGTKCVTDARSNYTPPKGNVSELITPIMEKWDVEDTSIIMEMLDDISDKRIRLIGTSLGKTLAMNMFPDETNIIITVDNVNTIIWGEHEVLKKYNSMMR